MPICGFSINLVDKGEILKNLEKKRCPEGNNSGAFSNSRSLDCGDCSLATWGLSSSGKSRPLINKPPSKHCPHAQRVCELPNPKAHFSLTPPPPGPPRPSVSPGDALGVPRPHLARPLTWGEAKECPATARFLRAHSRNCPQSQVCGTRLGTRPGQLLGERAALLSQDPFLQLPEVCLQNQASP